METIIPNGKTQTKSLNYKHVYKRRKKSVRNMAVWYAILGSQRKVFTTERAAARWVDIQLIRKGLDPVNLFKKK